MTADYTDLVDLTRLAHGALAMDSRQVADLTTEGHQPWLCSTQYGDKRQLRTQPAADGQGLVMTRDDAVEFVHRVLDYQLVNDQISEADHEQRLTEALVGLSTGL